MYLAFDIGVANLAYCIIDYKGKIKSWDVINLTDKLTEPVCCGKTKKGVVCGKKAKFVCHDIRSCLLFDTFKKN